MVVVSEEEYAVIGVHDSLNHYFYIVSFASVQVNFSCSFRWKPELLISV